MRYDGGYRLGVDVEAVDLWWAEALVEHARDRRGRDLRSEVLDLLERAGLTSSG